MKSLNSLFLALVIAIPFSAFPSDSTNAVSTRKPPPKCSDYEFGIGLGAGMTGGYGLSFQRWFTNSHGLQINLFPFYLFQKYPGDDNSIFYDENRLSGYSKEGLLSLGITYLYLIEEMPDIRILAYGSANTEVRYENSNYYEAASHYYDYDYSTYSGPTVHKVNHSTDCRAGAGGGLGASMTIWRFLGTGLIGFVGSYNFTEEEARISPSIDCSVQFLLKRKK